MDSKRKAGSQLSDRQQQISNKKMGAPNFNFLPLFQQHDIARFSTRILKKIKQTEVFQRG